MWAVYKLRGKSSFPGANAVCSLPVVYLLDGAGVAQRARPKGFGQEFSLARSGLI